MSDLAVSLLILIAFATGLSTGYYCGHAKGRIATLADLQRVSKSLAEGMSVGSAQGVNDVSALYEGAQQGRCLPALEGWTHYMQTPPSTDRVIEICRPEWASFVRAEVGSIHPETNVNGLYWRYPIARNPAFDIPRG